MERKVIGAGMMFLGSGCGPGLTEAQRAYLKNVEPGEFYPLEELLAMFDGVEKVRPELIYAAGRRWGNAVKDEMVKRGAKSIKEALFMVESVYLEHHQGDVGKLELSDDGANAVVIANRGPYPTILIAGAYEGIAAAMGGEEVRLEETEDPSQYRISWETGE